VVKDKKVHIDVINNVIKFVQNLGYKVLDLTVSPIKGPSGNVEYLIYLATEGIEKDFSVEKIVENKI
jgi:Predicted rRNA methylase